MYEIYKYCDTVIVWIGDDLKQPIEDHDMAIYQYSTSNWFSRIWTLQEAISPPRMIVLTNWGIVYSDIEHYLPRGYECGIEIGAWEILYLKEEKHL
ncbi:hypothetical protein K492DRAFT_201295 [Lichtheimia hyalospora FSU 10163]|nr:hypothetical protein K492DRAFT_201295 [Lichtheimia hyalospora FSU 10163]